MALNLFERFLLKFRRFKSENAANAELRGLTWQEARYRVEQKRGALLRAYVRGEISGYQCRVFLNDYIRDSIPLADEVAVIERHQQDIEIATSERKTPAEENEIEHSMATLFRVVRHGELKRAQAKARFERLIESLPESKQREWRESFADLCHDLD